MNNSLISVNKLILEGLKVEFDKDGSKVNNVHGTVVAQARREKNLYLLNVNVRKESANIKGHFFLKVKRLGLPSFWN
jgi:hypothetical protein